MAFKTIRELSVAFTAKTDSFDRNVDKVSRRTRVVESRFSSMAKTVATTAGVFSGIFSGAAALAIKRQIDLANHIGDVSNALGIATEELSRWNFIAERSGISTQDLERIVKDLADRSAKAAQGMNESRKALDQLDISAQKFVGLSFEEKILAVSSAFEGVKDSAERVRLAMALFGESGSKFLNIINSGRSGVEALIETSKEYANVIDSETAAAATRFNETLGEIQASIEKATLSLAKKFLPELENLASWFRNDFPKAVEAGSNFVKDGIGLADDFIQKWIEVRSFFGGGKEVSDAQFDEFFGKSAMEEANRQLVELTFNSDRIDRAMERLGISAEQTGTSLFMAFERPNELMDVYTKRWVDLGLTIEDVNVLAGQTAKRFEAISSETTGNRFVFEPPEVKGGNRFAIDEESTPEMQRKFRELDQDLVTILGRMDDIDDKGERVASRLSDSVGNAMADIVLDFENAGDAAENLFRSITNMIVNIAVREPLENFFAQAVGSLSGAAFSGSSTGGNATTNALTTGSSLTVAAAGRSSSPTIQVTQNIQTPDVASFNASQNQQMNQLRRGIQGATKNIFV